MYKVFLLILIALQLVSLTFCSKNFQAVHILDPDVPDFKRYESWNSDQWIKWLKARYEEDAKERRNSETATQNPEPLYGKWANIIVIASQESLEGAFTQNSQPAYTNGGGEDYFWSDVPFAVYVILRGPKGNGTQFNVHNCSDKKMYINAKLEMKTFKPIELKTFFPKQVKNPGDKLRVPLVVCKKVLQVRGLQDEIEFLLRASKQRENNPEADTDNETE